MRWHPQHEHLVGADDRPHPFDGETDGTLADEDGRGLGGGRGGLFVCFEEKKKKRRLFLPLFCPLAAKNEEKKNLLPFFRTIGSMTLRSR